MKIKEGFILRDIAGSWVVIPIGANVIEFSGMITLNDTGAFLWKLLQEGTDTSEMVSSLLQEYSVDEATANADVEDFILSVRARGLLV
jgi:hypothetical protein